MYVPRSTTKPEGVSKQRPLGPWLEQTCEVHNFAVLKSPSEIPDVLALAQMAILNPGTPIEHFAYSTGMPVPKLQYHIKFSPNIIQLDIEGSGLPNLSFYDLPGVINVSEVPEEEYVVALVKNLVKEYIQQEDCINLLTITMSDDPANSSASQLIRALKAEARTLGCLTKPDMLQGVESSEQWEATLDGKRFQLGYGYHVIKNNPDPSVSHDEARREEEAFFENEVPWSTTLGRHHGSFGTKSLQNALSRLLTKQIQKCLPRIRDKVSEKADAIAAELKDLPLPFDGLISGLIIGDLHKFERELEKEIDGGSESCDFQKNFYDIALKFQTHLAQRKPLLYVSPPKDQQLQRQAISRSSSVVDTPTPTTAKPRISKATAQAPVVIDSDEDAEVFQTSSQGSSKKRRIDPSFESSPRKASRFGSDTSRKSFQLQEVRGIIQSTYIGLPGQVHPKAVEKMIAMSMEHWSDPLKEFFKEVKMLTENMVALAIQKIFSTKQMTRFYDEVSSICESFIDKAFSDQLQLSERLLRWELSKPKTLNNEGMHRALDQARADLFARRRAARQILYILEHERKTGQDLDDETRREKAKKVPDDKLPAEEFGPELQAVAVSLSSIFHF